MINNDVTTTTKTLSVIDSSVNEMEIDLRVSSSTSSNSFDKNISLNSNRTLQKPQAAMTNQDDNHNSSNNESESEYENELIIATNSSETEDNLLSNSLNNVDEHQLQKSPQQNSTISSCGDL